jgi:hypothetical protein
MPDMMRPEIKAKSPLSLCRDPYISRHIFCKGADLRFNLRDKAGKGLCPVIKPERAMGSPHKHPIRKRADSRDILVSSSLQDTIKFYIIPIITAQTIICPQPYKAPVILYDIPYRIRTQSIFYRNITVEKVRSLFSKGE